jgi:hypothetical protein
MLIRGFINQMCGDTPTDFSMGVPAPTTNFDGLSITLTETQRKAATNFKFNSGRELRDLEDWLEAKPQRFAMLGIIANSYDAVVWVTSRFSGPPFASWWLNRKQQATIPDSFDSLVEDASCVRHPCCPIFATTQLKP